MLAHNAIIHAAAKKVLAPEGLFRMGSSRTWLDDNGYFVILAEFQPSGWDRGTYLNVGPCFLWEHTPALDAALTYDLGGRVMVDGRQFAACGEDAEAFSRAAERFAIAALEKVREYRQLRDTDRAKALLLEETGKRGCFWALYDLAMLCFLRGEVPEGMRRLERFIALLKRRAGDTAPWEEELLARCGAELCPRLRDAEAGRQMVTEMILRRRTFFRGKSSCKKMRADAFPSPDLSGQGTEGPAGRNCQTLAEKT